MTTPVRRIAVDAVADLATWPRALNSAMVAAMKNSAPYILPSVLCLAFLAALPGAAGAQGLATRIPTQKPRQAIPVAKPHLVAKIGFKTPEGLSGVVEPGRRFPIGTTFSGVIHVLIQPHGSDNAAPITVHTTLGYAHRIFQNDRTFAAHSIRSSTTFTVVGDAINQQLTNFPLTLKVEADGVAAVHVSAGVTIVAPATKALPKAP